MQSDNKGQNAQQAVKKFHGHSENETRFCQRAAQNETVEERGKEMKGL